MLSPCDTVAELQYLLEFLLSSIFKQAGGVKRLDALKSEFEETIRSQVADMVADGEELPSWLISGDYRIEFMAVQ